MLKRLMNVMFLLAVMYGVPYGAGLSGTEAWVETTWQQTNVPYGGNILSIAIDPNRLCHW